MPRWLGDLLWFFFMPAVLLLHGLREAAPLLAVVLLAVLVLVLACR